MTAKTTSTTGTQSDGSDGSDGGGDASPVLAAVAEVIEDVLRQAGREAEAITADQQLTNTGLGSLDLAAVVARLEQHFAVDPFLQHVAITEMRTVGDLANAYETCLAGDDLGGDDDLREAMERARRRGV